jgi:hypothetical protein
MVVVEPAMRLLDAVTGELEHIARRSNHRGLQMQKLALSARRKGFIRRGVRRVFEYLKGFGIYRKTSSRGEEHRAEWARILELKRQEAAKKRKELDLQAGKGG